MVEEALDKQSWGNHARYSGGGVGGEGIGHPPPPGFKLTEQSYCKEAFNSPWQTKLSFRSSPWDLFEGGTESVDGQFFKQIITHVSVFEWIMKSFKNWITTCICIHTCIMICHVKIHVSHYSSKWLNACIKQIKY